jgi:hypothetical protein
MATAWGGNCFLGTVLALAACASQAADAADAAHAAETEHPLALNYARYLAHGRGEVEIHLIEAGDPTTARIQPRGDGSFSCEVAGLQKASAEVLVHEVMHCQTAAWLGPLRASVDTPAEVDAWVVLTAESISDARAVFEVWRVDGDAAAQALLARLRVLREPSRGTGHATQRALDAAQAEIARAPQLYRHAAMAFEAALRVGFESATLEMAARGLPVPQAPRLAIAQALAQAGQAYAGGRWSNATWTLHARSGTRHYALGPDGAPNSMTGAGAAAPDDAGQPAFAQAMLQAQASAEAEAPAETQLASRWLKRHGLLNAQSLQKSSLAFARFMRSAGSEDDLAAGRLVAVLSALIEQLPRGSDLGTLFDEAHDQWRNGPVAVNGI